MAQSIQDEAPREGQIELKTKPRHLPKTFISLMYRDFRYLWLGMVFSNAGFWMEMA